MANAFFIKTVMLKTIKLCLLCVQSKLFISGFNDVIQNRTNKYYIKMTNFKHFHQCEETNDKTRILGTKLQVRLYSYLILQSINYKTNELQ